MSDQAITEKNLGNEAYKKRDFATAHTHYDKAIQLDSANATFYNNKAAAFFEEAKYAECIKQCEKAVEVGRENHADTSVIAKAYARAANAYQKQALHYFKKSLSEHSDPKVVKKQKALEKALEEQERLSYINPELSDKARQKGNELFMKGDYTNAMKAYNEAIKRDPENAGLYSNRAACYIELKEFQRAVDDCETSLKKDPKFVKGYIRKGAALWAMHEWSRAHRAYEDALAIDPSSAEAQEGLRQLDVNHNVKLAVVQAAGLPQTVFAGLREDVAEDLPCPPSSSSSVSTAVEVTDRELLMRINEVVATVDERLLTLMEQLMLVVGAVDGRFTGLESQLGVVSNDLSTIAEATRQKMEKEGELFCKYGCGKTFNNRQSRANHYKRDKKTDQLKCPKMTEQNADVDDAGEGTDAGE